VVGVGVATAGVTDAEGGLGGAAGVPEVGAAVAAATVSDEGDGESAQPVARKRAAATTATARRDLAFTVILGWGSSPSTLGIDSARHMTLCHLLTFYLLVHSVP
jgi:hypothetical protein